MIGDDYLQLRAQLGTSLFALASLARELEAPPEVAETLHQLDANLREPFLFVVVGEVKAGKSSLLNGLFGRDLCRTDVLPATDKIYVFKHGEQEHDVQISDTLTESYRHNLFLRDFNIVDTPGTNTILAEHQTITERYVPMADVVLFVFSVTNPWAGSAWEFLGYVHDRWLKNVIFVVQQSDLRTPAEVETVVAHLRQTIREKLHCEAPVFAVSARQAFLARHQPEVDRAQLEASGLEQLESCISEMAARGDARLGKLRSVCQTALVLLRQVSEKARASFGIIKQDTEKLRHLYLGLDDRKEQSLRQIGGVLWTLSQAYEQSQRRGEQMLLEKLTLGQTFRMIFHKCDWQEEFRKETEVRLQQSIQTQMQTAVEMIEGDLRDVWRQLQDSLKRSFRDAPLSAAGPDFLEERAQLLRVIDQALQERSSDQQIEQQMSQLFSETANWLRIPAGVAAVGGLATVVAALAHLAVVDLTGTVAGLAAIFGTVVAVVKRHRILAEFREQMRTKRTAVLSTVEGHLRQSIDEFYRDLQTAFQPLHAFCNTQRRELEPKIVRIKQLAERFSKISTDLGLPRRPTTVTVNGES